MIHINLLPHREERRKQRRIEFYVMAALALISAAVIVFIVGLIISNEIEDQTQRNDFIRTENAKLDEQIKEIADLRSEIDSLKARQQAVEDLQGDRNLPVHLLDELVKQTPEGIFLTNSKQVGNKVTLTGYAQSNDRISEMLRNLSNNSPWLANPDLVEIKAATIGSDKRRVSQFTMNVDLRRPVTDKPVASAAAVAVPATPANPAAAAATK
ncbi:MAG: PilN domain-containing protein [Burkholderiaceae bacterium]|jgi:type IV pilus assembly protein PilN